MKLKLFLFVLSLISISYRSFAQTAGGPDAFGYKWVNSQDPLGPSYNWKDIKVTGKLVSGLGDDDSAGPFDLKFYFNYYGTWYNSVWIGSNGWISFQPLGNIAAPFPSIPSSLAPNNFIAGMLSDLTLKDLKSNAVPGAAAYFWTNLKDSAIIQFDSIPFWTDNASGYSGRNTFQLILSGSTGSITFQYKQLIDSSPAYNLSVTGLRAGIEDTTGKGGLQVLSDVFPAPSSAIKISYPATFSTNDLDNSVLSVGQNYPNPCSNFTNIPYTLLKNESIKITILNMVGSEIESFSPGKMSAGSHSFALNTQAYPPGIYFYSLSFREGVSTRKMIVFK